MNLSDLQRAGGIISGELFSREVEWVSPSGEKLSFSVFSRKPSYADIEDATKAERDGVCSTVVFLISRCIALGDGGKDSLNIADIRRLEPSLFNTLYALLYLPEPQKEGETKKPSQRKKRSGTSLS